MWRARHRRGDGHRRGLRHGRRCRRSRRHHLRAHRGVAARVGREDPGRRRPRRRRALRRRRRHGRSRRHPHHGDRGRGHRHARRRGRQRGRWRVAGSARHAAGRGLRAGAATQRHRHVPHRQALTPAADRSRRVRSSACRRSPARTPTVTSPGTPRGRPRSSRSCATPPTSTARSACASTRCGPAFITTEIMEGISRDGSTYASYLANTPLGRVGTPEEVAHVVRFLLGAESQWVTGQIINIDGGNSLRSGPDYGELVVMMHGADAIPGATAGQRTSSVIATVWSARTAARIDAVVGRACRSTRTGGWRSAGAGRGTRLRGTARSLAATRQLGEEDRGQRSVHDEVGIALDARRVRVVVVDAVRVGGDGREAEQQHRVGDELLDPLGRRARRHGRARRRGGGRPRGRRGPAPRRCTPRRPG